MTHWYFWSPVQRRRITSYVMQQEAWTLKLTVTKPTLLYFRRLSRSTEFADIRSIQVTFFLPNVGLIFIVQSYKWLYLFFYNTHFQPAVLFSARYEALTKSPLDAFILLNLYLPCVSSRLTWSSSFNKAKKKKKISWSMFDFTHLHVQPNCTFVYLCSFVCTRHSLSTFTLAFHYAQNNGYGLHLISHPKQSILFKNQINLKF